jgi:hypothetical protein
LVQELFAIRLRPAPLEEFVICSSGTQAHSPIVL